MSHLLIDSAPAGGRRWTMALEGECTAGCGPRLADEARALLLVGADRIEIDLGRLDYLDLGGAAALAVVVASIEGFGVPVSVSGAAGQPALLLSTAGGG